VLLVDTALRAREEQGNPIRVAIVGAGFMSQGLTNQIAQSTPGMRIVADRDLPGATVVATSLEEVRGLAKELPRPGGPVGSR